MNVNILFELLENNKENVPLLKDLIDTYPELLNEPTDGISRLIIRAAAKGYKILVERLIQHPKVNINIQDRYRNTALIFAVFNNEPEIAILLIKAGANIHLTDNYSKNAMDYIDRIKNIDSRNEVKKLLMEEMQSMALNPYKNTINIDTLGSLVLRYIENTKLVNTLLAAHKHIISDKMKTFTNLLFMAVNVKSETLAKALIDHKIDLNCGSEHHNIMALIYAIKNDIPNIVIQIIEAEADITIKDSNGRVAYDYLDYISNYDQRDKIRELLESKMPKPVETIEEIKPVETPKPEEIKPEIIKPEVVPKQFYAISMSGPGNNVAFELEKPATNESASYQLVKFLGENSIDYSFSSNTITADSTIKLVTFALEHNIPYKVSGAKIMITLK